MSSIKDELLEAEELESKILELFDGKRDFILMSALTMVTARVIVFQKKQFPNMDVESVMMTFDDQLRHTVNGTLDALKKGDSEP
jgi:hypothetical protein